MDIIQSRKGKNLIYFKGFTYRQDQRRATKLGWRCVKNKCKGRVTTTFTYAETKEDPIESGFHYHLPSPVERELRILENNVKSQAQMSNDSPREILEHTLGVASEEVVENLRSSHALSRMVARKRRTMSKLLYDLKPGKEFNIPANLRVTHNGQPFLRFEGPSEDGSFMYIFTTDRMLQLLIDNDKWMADGTFKTAPKVSYQFYTVHAICEHCVVPVIYALLQKKTTEVYQSMWTRIHELSEKLNPSSIELDFEYGAITAVQRVFPEIQVNGCFFHLGQSIWRRMEHVGLQQAYIENANVRRFSKLLASLAFLPIGKVEEGFAALVNHKDFPDVLIEFFLYFHETYIGNNEDKKATFPLFMWSVRHRCDNGLPKTNNQLEVWHKAFQVTLQCTQPLLSQFIKLLQNEQASWENNLTLISSGGMLKQQTQMQDDANKRLTTIINQPINNYFEFLKDIASNLDIFIA